MASRKGRSSRTGADVKRSVTFSSRSDGAQNLGMALALHQQGDLVRAKALYEQILNAEPNHPETLHYLGILTHQMGQPEGAVELIRQAISHNPGNGNYHNNLGNVLEALGRLEEALAEYEEARSLSEGDPYVHFNAGNVLQKLGQLDEAEQSFRKALDIAPNDGDFHFNLANVLKQRGQLEAAAASYERAIAIGPSPDMLNNQGNTLRDLGRLQGAVDAYRRSLQLRHDDAGVHNNLGNTLGEMGEVEEAIACYRRALGIDPRFATAYLNLGTALRQSGRFEAAREAYEQALRIDDEHAATYNNLGQLYMDEGDQDQARTYFRKALALHPELPEAHLNLARSHRFGDADREDVERMESLVARSDFPAEGRVALHFALGKIYDDVSDPEKAFAHYRQGNEIKGQSVAFNPAGYREWIGNLQSVFHEGFFQQRKHLGDPSQLPLFVVGMPRSGTTLVEQILASHPRVHGAGELTIIAQLSEQLAERVGTTLSYPHSAALLDEKSVPPVARHYLSALRATAPGSTRVTDKTPGNVFHLGLIALLFPNTRIVHCRRDAMDLCFSNYTQLFANGHYYSYDLSSIAHYYKGYERLMDHWRSALPLPIHEVSYEALLDNPEESCRALLAFCDLPWNERCLEFHKTPRRVQTASQWQVRQPLYQTAKGRWKRYERFLLELKNDLGHHGV